MFRKIVFGHFLNYVKFVFNGLLCHFILLRVVKERWDDIISFKLLGDKVFFRREDFNTIKELRYRSRHEVQFE